MRLTNIIGSTIEPVVINSVSELFDKIHEFNINGTSWFRGQNNSDYYLTPSIIRRAIRVKDQFGRRVKPRPVDVMTTYNDTLLIPDFKYLNVFREYLNRNYIAFDNEMSEYEFMCLAQHYGVRTRLLDWSTDATVALFFAIDGREDDADAALYVFDPGEFNKQTTLSEKIFDVGEIEKVWDGFLPIAFYGPRDDKRMCRQSGNFTLQGSDFRPIDCLPPAKDFLHKVIIPDAVANELKDWLFGMGINRESIYIGDDEKDKIARRAQEETEKAFESDIDRFTKEWEEDDEKGIEDHFVYDFEMGS